MLNEVYLSIFRIFCEPSPNSNSRDLGQYTYLPLIHQSKSLRSKTSSKHLVFSKSKASTVLNILLFLLYWVNSFSMSIGSKNSFSMFVESMPFRRFLLLQNWRLWKQPASGQRWVWRPRRLALDLPMWAPLRRRWWWLWGGSVLRWGGRLPSEGGKTEKPFSQTFKFPSEDEVTVSWGNQDEISWLCRG